MTVRIPKVVLVALAIVLAAGAGVGATLLLTGGDGNDEENRPLRTYRVPSGAMEPTFKVGDVIGVDREKDAKVGDVIVFLPPKGALNGNTCGVSHESDQPCPRPTPERANVSFIKRIVADSGDTIAIRGGHTVVNGKVQDERFIEECPVPKECDFPKPIEVPPAHVFVLGDNRGASDDSRFWGPVPRSSIVGVVVAK